MSSYSVIRRYTPPTCTLKILAQKTFLGGWKQQSLGEELRFELRFDDPRLPEEEQITLRGDRSALELLCHIVIDYVQHLLEGFSTQTPVTKLSPDSSTPSLSSKGLLAHELVLASLATQTSGKTLHLSTLQLFDLANALEKYSTEIVTLPQIEGAKSRRRTLTRVGSAVAIAFVIGLPIGITLYEQSNSDSEDNLAQQEVPSPQPAPIEVIPPVLPAPEDSATPSPDVPSPLASAERLPPPPPVSSPQPIERNFPLPSTPNPTPTDSAPLPQAPQVVITPAPSTANLPSSQPSTATPVEPTSPGFSEQNQSTPNLPELPPLQPRPTDLTITPSGNVVATTPSDTDTTPPRPEGTNIDGAGDVAANTLLDDIPQVAEVREYFQNQWQPPASLNQTLEYRLVLDSDGSIGRIIPLGQAAKIYLDRTGIPLMGESFVSPLKEATNPQIRLVLSPDGTVQTFLE